MKLRKFLALALVACGGATQNGTEVVSLPQQASSGSAGSQVALAQSTGREERDTPIPITNADAVWGNRHALVTLVEFSDFQCPYCGREYPVVERVMKEYEGKVRLVFRHYPLEMHPFAQKAAEAAACAQDQGKFWELHDKMFTNQSKLAVDDLKGYAKAVGMDASKFDKCLDSGEKKALVDDDMKAGSAAGVSGTPAFFINGVFVNGAQPYDQMKQTIDRELSRKG